MTFDERIAAISTARKTLLAIQERRKEAIGLWNHALSSMGISTSVHVQNVVPGPSLGTFDLNTLGKSLAEWTAKEREAMQELGKHRTAYDEEKRKAGAI